MEGNRVIAPGDHAITGQGDALRFSGRVPIVIGVTGHRDIADPAGVERALDRQLRILKWRYPESPFVMLSGLAEGADRMAARRAFDLGIPVIGVLALPQPEFEADFPDSAGEFRELLAQCLFVREAAPSGTARPDCYVAVGEWIARQCHVLIAVWDGVESDKPGGTCMVKNACLKGGSHSRGESARPTMPDTNPVLHIDGRRIRSSGDSATRPEASPECPEARWLWPSPSVLDGVRVDKGMSEEARWNAIFAHIDRFNAGAAELLDTRRGALDAQRQAYLNGGGKIDLPGGRSEAVLASWLFIVADALAQAAQQARHRSFLWMIGFSLVAVFFEQLYSGPDENPLWLLIAIGSVVLAIVPVVIRALAPLDGRRGARRGARVLPGVLRKWGSAEDRYLDFRALAEAARVQYFWKRAGIADCVADFHLADQYDELEWIRQAMRTTELAPAWSPGMSAAPMSVEIATQLCRHWIVDQKEYFLGSEEKKRTGKSQSHQTQAARWHRLSWIFLAATLVAVLMALAMEFIAEPGLASWCQFLYGTFLALGAACKIYQRAQGHEDHAQSYRQMGLGMVVSERKLEQSIEAMQRGDGGAERAREVLFETGINALDENSNWLLLHRTRPVGPTLGS